MGDILSTGVSKWKEYITKYSFFVDYENELSLLILPKPITTIMHSGILGLKKLIISFFKLIWRQ